MNRNQAKELLPILQAFAKGKVIQVKNNNVWKDIDNNHNCVFLPDSYKYRIKPEPKYRPFANAEECWQEMLKHQPFGWIKSVDDKNPEVFIHCAVITKVDGILTDLDEIPFPYDGMYKNYTFIDGTPFGIKIEEED